MLFNTLNFFVFLFCVCILYVALPAKLKWLFLLLASSVFYIISSSWLILIPLAIILITYFVSFKVRNDGLKNPIFHIGWVSILSFLLFYKYLGFLSGIFAPGADGSFLINSIVAPIGISYITFQAIGYLIDIRNGKILPEKNLGLLSTFLLYFPKIIAGPVERPQHIIPQLVNYPVFKFDDVIAGVQLICWGLLKKLVVADRIQVYFSPVFNDPSANSGLPVLIAVLLFPLQVYMDFSGYTDIARGVSRLFGIELMQNFNRPFASQTITEFWRRWHISLSSWFNDYVFTPLTISTRNWKNYGLFFSLLFTFSIIGLWHGPTWNFVLFGAINGFIIFVETVTKKARKKVAKKTGARFLHAVGVFYVYVILSFSFIFIKTGTIEGVATILKSIATMPLYQDTLEVFQHFIHKTPFDPHTQMNLFAYLGNLLLSVDVRLILVSTVLIIGVEYLINNTTAFFVFISKNRPLRWSSYFLLIFYIMEFGIYHSASEFIYFKF